MTKSCYGRLARTQIQHGKRPESIGRAIGDQRHEPRKNGSGPTAAHCKLRIKGP